MINKSLTSQPLLLKILVVIISFSFLIGIAEAQNNPPEVGPIRVISNPPYSSYSVEASDPNGDTMSFSWSTSNLCGTFVGQQKTALWQHPHPPCGEELEHPGTITLVVNDGHGNSITRTYKDGSSAGIGTAESSSSGTVYQTTEGFQALQGSQLAVSEIRVMPQQGFQLGDKIAINARKLSWSCSNFCWRNWSF